MVDERQEAQTLAAASRIAARAPQRAEHVGALATSDGVGQVNPPERIARRLDRLTRYYADEPAPTTAAGVPTAAPENVLAAARERSVAPLAPKAVREAVQSVGDSPGVVLERIINTADFVDIRFLEAGVAAARAVGRVDIRDQAGKLVGYGTGSLVSPRLLLTNHHVLPEVDVAKVSSIEFDFRTGSTASRCARRSSRSIPTPSFWPIRSATSPWSLSQPVRTSSGGSDATRSSRPRARP